MGQLCQKLFFSKGVRTSQPGFDLQVSGSKGPEENGRGSNLETGEILPIEQDGAG